MTYIKHLTCILTLAAALTLSACASAPKKATIAPRPVSASLQTTLDDMGDMPFVGYIHTDQEEQLNQTLQAVTDGLPLNTEQGHFKGILSQSLGIPLNEIPSLKALDNTRPVVFGLPGSVTPEASTLRYGGLLSESQLPTWSHGRIILPSKDPARLIQELSTILQDTAGAFAQLAPKDWQDISPQSVYIKVINTHLILLSEPGQVRVEIALGALNPPVALTEMAKLYTQQTANPLPNTPARTHLMEGAGIAGLYINMDRLIEFSVLHGQQQLFEALKYASPESKNRLYAAGLQYSLYPVLVAAPGEQNVTDVTLSVSAGASSELRVTQSLTERSATAHQKASTQKGNTYAARHPDPWAQLRVQANLRALLTTAPPSWMQELAEADATLMLRESAEILNDAGVWPLLYTSLNQPTLFLAGTKWEGIDIHTLFPQSLSAVVEDIDIQPESPPTATASLLLEFPAGPAPTFLTDNLSALQEMGKTFMPWMKLSINTKEEAKHTHLTITLGDKAPTEIFAMDTPINQGPDLTWKRRSKRDQNKSTIEYLQNTGMIGAAGILIPDEGIMEVYQASQTIRMRMDWVQPSTPPPAMTAIRIPHTLPKASDSVKEDKCMILSTRSTTQFLAAFSHSTSEFRQSLIAASSETAPKELMDSMGAQKLSSRSQQILQGRQLLAIKLMAEEGYYDDALKRVTTLCKTYQAACPLQQQLQNIYPEGSLTLPALALPTTQTRVNAAHKLILSTEGVYLDGKRIADIARLNEGQNFQMDWLARLLPLSNRDTIEDRFSNFSDDATVQLLVDRATPYKVLYRVLYTLESRQYTAMLTYTHNSQHTHLALPIPSTATSVSPPLPEDTNNKVYLFMQPGSLTIIQNKQLVGAFTRSPALGGLGIDDKGVTAAVAKLYKTNPGTIFHLSIQAEIDTEATLQLVRLLQGPNLENPIPILLGNTKPR